MPVVTIDDREAMVRADRARSILENSEFAAAFAAVRESLLTKIEEAPIRDREAVHECKLMLKLLNDVRANLQSVVNTGKVIESRTTMLDMARKGLNNAFRR